LCTNSGENIHNFNTLYKFFQQCDLKLWIHVFERVFKMYEIWTGQAEQDIKTRQIAQERQNVTGRTGQG
jgi:hypothetical protein